MTTKFSTGISPEYVRNWDVGKAVREIIQNYLDSIGRPGDHATHPAPRGRSQAQW